MNNQVPTESRSAATAVGLFALFCQVNFSFLQLHYKSISLIIYSSTTLVEVQVVAVDDVTNMRSEKSRAKGSFFAFEVDLGDVRHGGKMLSGQNS